MNPRPPVPTLDAEQLAMLTREELKTLIEAEVGSGLKPEFARYGGGNNPGGRD